MAYRIVDGKKIELSHEEESALLAEWSQNDLENGKEKIKQQMKMLETQQTPRRIREAFISGDISFFEEIEIQIQELRQQLAQL